MADFEISIGADLSELESDLAGINKRITSAFKGVGSSVQKELNKAQAAATKLRTDVTAGAKKTQAAFRAVKEAAGALGFGAAAEQAEKVKNAFEAAEEAGGELAVSALKVAGGLGAAALSGAAGVAAIIAVTKATFDAIRATEGWIEELEELGIAVDDDAVASLERFNDAIDATVVAGKVGLIPLLAGIAEAAEPIAVTAVQVSLAFEDAFGPGRAQVIVRDYLKILTLLDPTLATIAATTENLSLVTAGYREEAEALIDAQREQAFIVDVNKRGLLSFIDITEALENVQRVGAIAADDEADAQKRATDRKREAERAARDFVKALEEQEKAQQSLIDITDKANEDLLTDEQRILMAFEDRQRAIEDNLLLAQDAALVREALAANEERLFRDLAQLRVDETNRVRDAELSAIRVVETMRRDAAARSITLAQEQAIQALEIIEGFAANAADLAADAATRTQTALRAAQETLRVSEEAKKQQAETGEAVDGILTASEEKRVRKSIALLKEQESEQLQAANNAAKTALAVQKAVSIQQIAIAGFETYAKLVAFFAFTGPAAFGIAAGIQGPATAAQIALVAAQRAPSFQTGGLVDDRIDGDHTLISAQRGEGILKPEGVEAVGGREGIDRLNAGVAPNQTIIVQVDAVAVAEAILNNPTAERMVARAVRSRSLQGSF